MTDGRVRLLLVEDDEPDYLLTRDVLAEIQGMTYDLDWVASYEEAIEAINRQEHDVYLLDYHLGVHTGLELLQTIAASGGLAPAILLTGQRDHRIDIEAMEAGAADYLVKSEITPALLERAIRYARRYGRIRQSERRFRTLIHRSFDGMALIGPEGTLRYISPAIRRILGYAEEDLVGSCPLHLVHLDDLEAIASAPEALAGRPGKAIHAEVRVLHQDGRHRWLEVVATNLLEEPGVHAVVLNVRDCTERKQLEERLVHQALHDPLTDLPNHGALVEALDRELARTRRFQRSCAVLFLDIDHFKAINDTCGHQDGDAVLRAFAAIIRSSLRITDTTGRWGGEEFMAVLPETDLASAVLLAERLRIAVAATRFPAGPGRHVTCSIGVAVFSDDGVTRDELLVAADRALYAAKRFGRNQTRTANEPGVFSLASMAAAIDPSHDSVLVGTVEALAALVQARDRHTGQHIHEVAELAVRLAVSLGLDTAKVRTVGIAGLLHDIGKVAVPDVVLQKPGLLSAEEWMLIRGHSVIGAEVINHIPTLRMTAPVIRSHHERWDGAGYPDGLAGEAIPLGARIVAVADAFSAMTTNRPYRYACTPVLALAELRRHAGTQFDPAAVAALEYLLEADQITSLRADASLIGERSVATRKSVGA